MSDIVSQDEIDLWKDLVNRKPKDFVRARELLLARFPPFQAFVKKECGDVTLYAEALYERLHGIERNARPTPIPGWFDNNNKWNNVINSDDWEVILVPCLSKTDSINKVIAYRVMARVRDAQIPDGPVIDVIDESEGPMDPFASMYPNTLLVRLNMASSKALLLEAMETLKKQWDEAMDKPVSAHSLAKYAPKESHFEIFCLVASGLPMTDKRIVALAGGNPKTNGVESIADNVGEIFKKIRSFVDPNEVAKAWERKEKKKIKKAIL